MECSWHTVYTCFDTAAFTLGPVTVYWYAGCFFLGWLLASAFIFTCRERFSLSLPREGWFDFLLGLLFAGVIGGRLGYALFYYPSFFIAEPWRLIIPYDPATGAWTGISGMSFHGGLLAIALYVFFFARLKRLSLWALGDLVALGAPIALFLGRLGNFLNQELVGRPTELAWGIYFPGQEGLRHPVALYEALGEGLFLFLLLYYFSWRPRKEGSLMLACLVGYAVIRFGLEFFRLPDPQVGFLWGSFTMGQILSVGVLIVAGGLWFFRQKRVTIISD